MSSAFEALSEGRKATAIGEFAAAQRWFERALRLAPGNSEITLALAGAKLLQHDAESVDLFASVARDHDMREAWLGLAIGYHQQAEIIKAAEAIGQALRRHAFIKALTATADAVATAVDAPGWCGLDGAGRLIIQLARASSGQLKPSAMVDDQPVNLRARPGGRTFTARLPENWEQSRNVVARLGVMELLGSPLAIDAIVRVEGFVASTDGDLHGWAWCPHDPDREPVLSILPLQGGNGVSVTARDPAGHIWNERPLSSLRGFQIPALKLRYLDGLLRICGHDGRSLTGSPLDPSAERRSAEAAAEYIARQFPAPGRPKRSALAKISLLPVPVRARGEQPDGGVTRRSVDVVVPVYNGIDVTRACLETVLADLPRWARVVVVDDASPDPRVRQELGKLAKKHRITLLTQTLNRGFPAAANSGLRHDPTRDAVLLNSDTLTPPGWLRRLRDAAYSAPEIGSATPLSNDATIVSYPDADQTNAIPQLDETVRLDALAQQANADSVVDIPTAVGFCMYIKRDCLNATGLFREDLFAQGYGEENDFCMRARHLGWRHVAVPGVFVAHVGGQSFGPAKRYLIERNTKILNRLHPGYDELIRDFQQNDPLAEPRRRLDMSRWKTFRPTARSVLLVTHDRGGGVQRRVTERAATLRAEGLRPVMLWPVASRAGGGHDCVVGNGPEGGTPNLRFAIPSELGILARFLKSDRPARAEVHHLIGHDHALLGLFRRLRIPYEVVIHDYNWICPRVSLIGSNNRYCGEPDVGHCEACVTDAGAMNEEDIAPQALRERSLAELLGASRVVAPTQDTATRLNRHFPLIQTETVAWEDDAAMPPSEPRPIVFGDFRRICVVGAIGIAKGYEVLLACARDAAMRSLNLEFCLVGFSCDDARLLATGRVHITGRYQEHEAVALIRAQRAQLGWLPSLWPETWCYTLTQTWQAGLDVVAFDIGAPAERIRRTGRGWLYPLGLSPSALNAELLAL